MQHAQMLVRSPYVVTRQSVLPGNICPDVRFLAFGSLPLTSNFGLETDSRKIQLKDGYGSVAVINVTDKHNE